VALNPRTFGWLVRRTLEAAFDDDCLGIAKGAAYSALLSFFPMLASSAAILLQTRAEFVSHAVENTLSEIVPPGSEELVVQQFRVTGARPLALLVIAGVVSIWAASGVIKSLIDGFQAAYRLPRSRDWIRLSLVAMALVLGCGVPLLLTAVLVVFGGQVERAVLNWVNLDPLLTQFSFVWRWIGRAVRYGLASGAAMAVSSLLYYFGPYRRQKWRFVWPGAAVCSLFWILATSGFAWYTQHMAHYNVMYGSIGAGIAMLVWMYVMAVVALIGCEFNAELERSTGYQPSPAQAGVPAKETWPAGPVAR
jgi:membrane protein